ncbi:unnamed protein product [Cladocopium goreaui]|uniref:Uncharacterized protein n=1 Tax=Cladocopium goreaui TaxID=2562237 RepID=A0A9P1FGZ2_9DINO|nr:unnamed protein product [Cladocopium goreaui]
MHRWPGADATTATIIPCLWGQRTASAVYDSKTRWATCLLGTQASHALPIFAPLGGFKVSRWLCQSLPWKSRSRRLRRRKHKMAFLTDFNTENFRQL